MRISRRVAVRTLFLASPRLSLTRLLALVPARLGKIFAQEGYVRALAAPIKLPSYVVKHYWHERYHRDPGNIWLRSLIADVMRDRLKG
jgi:hypothetical protein